MNEKTRASNDNIRIDLQNESISSSTQQLTQKDTSSMPINNSNKKPVSKTLGYYIVICFYVIIVISTVKDN